MQATRRYCHSKCLILPRLGRKSALKNVCSYSQTPLLSTEARPHTEKKIRSQGSRFQRKVWWCVLSHPLFSAHCPPSIFFPHQTSSSDHSCANPGIDLLYHSESAIRLVKSEFLSSFEGLGIHGRGEPIFLPLSLLLLTPDGSIFACHVLPQNGFCDNNTL